MSKKNTGSGRSKSKSKKKKSSQSSQSGGGALSSMRGGFKGIVSVKGGPKKKRSKTYQIVSWSITLILTGLVVYLLIRRFG